MVMLLDLGTHAGHGGEHFGAHILRRILRWDRKITLLDRDVVTEIAALVCGVGIGGKLDRIKLEPGVVRVGLVLDVVEDEELGLGPEVDRIADTQRFDHSLGFLGDAARVAGIGLAGGWLQHVAHQYQRRLGKERVDARG